MAWPEVHNAPGYEDLFRCKEQLTKRCGLDGAYFADLEQNPGCGPAAVHGLIPPLVSHGCLHSLSLGRPATHTEHLVCQGMPVLPSLTDANGGPCGAQGLLDSHSISAAALKRLAGNAMNVISLGKQTIFLLAHVQRPALFRVHSSAWGFHGGGQGDEETSEPPEFGPDAASEDVWEV